MTISEVVQKPLPHMNILMPFTAWFLDEGRLTVQQIAMSIGISSDSVHTVSTEFLGMSNQSAR